MRSNGGEVDRGEEEGRTGNFNSVYKLKMCCGFVSVEGLFLVVFFFFSQKCIYLCYMYAFYIYECIFTRRLSCTFS